MSVTYASLTQYKTEIGETTATNDDRHASDLEEASRAFDAICRRPDGWFYAATATKYFDVPRGGTRNLWIPPLQSVTSIKTDEGGDSVYETTWATTDYRLYPLAGPPYTEVRIHDGTGRYNFPIGDARVQIIGAWGETATGTPLPVQKAVRLLARRYSIRPNTPEALLAGTNNMMALGAHDPDVKTIIERGGYMNHTAVFA